MTLLEHGNDWEELVEMPVSSTENENWPEILVEVSGDVDWKVHLVVVQMPCQRVGKSELMA